MRERLAGGCLEAVSGILAYMKTKDATSTVTVIRSAKTGRFSRKQVRAAVRAVKSKAAAPVEANVRPVTLKAG